eukprot:6386732-Pyramimonas_sp.AAC.1
MGISGLTSFGQEGEDGVIQGLWDVMVRHEVLREAAQDFDLAPRDHPCIRGGPIGAKSTASHQSE